MVVVYVHAWHEAYLIDHSGGQGASIVPSSRPGTLLLLTEICPVKYIPSWLCLLSPIRAVVTGQVLRRAEYNVNTLINYCKLVVS